MTDATENLPEIPDVDLAAMTDDELADMLTGFAAGIQINLLLNQALVESARRLREARAGAAPKPAGAECYTDEQGREICVLPPRKKDPKCSSTAPGATSRLSRSKARK